MTPLINSTDIKGNPYCKAILSIVQDNLPYLEGCPMLILHRVTYNPWEDGLTESYTITIKPEYLFKDLDHLNLLWTQEHDGYYVYIWKQNSATSITPKTAELHKAYRSSSLYDGNTTATAVIKTGIEDVATYLTTEIIKYLELAHGEKTEEYHPD